MTSSWLCRDDMDRERLLDMERHVRPVRVITIAIIAIATIGSAGWLGLGTMSIVAAAALLAAGLFALADRSLEHTQRPEYVMFAAWTGAQVVIAGCLILTGGPESPGLAWMAIPVVTLSARFSERGVVLGVLITLGLLAVATFGVDASAVIDDPPAVTAAAVAVVCVAILSTALMRSDVHYRGEAVIDQLTGMLNRKALADRTSELAQQSAISGQPVGMIVGDIDRFKRINDSLGHAGGDAVLKDVAYRLRKRMRAFDLSYRIGGEEFLILLPGASSKESAALAEELRRTIEGEALGGIGMTMSFGVAASAKGERFDYKTVFVAADAALYEAKRNGRNRVCAANGRGSAGEPARELALSGTAG